MTFLFLVIDLVLRIFPFFSHIFRMFTMLNVVYDYFLKRKIQFFTLFMPSRTSDNTTSPPQILGDRPPQSPPRSPPLYLPLCTLNVPETMALFVTQSLDKTLFKDYL